MTVPQPSNSLIPNLNCGKSELKVGSLIKPGILFSRAVKRMFLMIENERRVEPQLSEISPLGFDFSPPAPEYKSSSEQPRSSMQTVWLDKPLTDGVLLNLEPQPIAHHSFNQAPTLSLTETFSRQNQKGAYEGEITYLYLVGFNDEHLQTVRDYFSLEKQAEQFILPHSTPQIIQAICNQLEQFFIDQQKPLTDPQQLTLEQLRRLADIMENHLESISSQIVFINGAYREVVWSPIEQAYVVNTDVATEEVKGQLSERVQLALEAIKTGEAITIIQRSGLSGRTAEKYGSDELETTITFNPDGTITTFFNYNPQPLPQLDWPPPYPFELIQPPPLTLKSETFTSTSRSPSPTSAKTPNNFPFKTNSKTPFFSWHPRSKTKSPPSPATKSSLEFTPEKANQLVLTKNEISPTPENPSPPQSPVSPNFQPKSNPPPMSKSAIPLTSSAGPFLEKKSKRSPSLKKTVPPSFNRSQEVSISIEKHSPANNLPDHQLSLGLKSKDLPPPNVTYPHNSPEKPPPVSPEAPPALQIPLTEEIFTKLTTALKEIANSPQKEPVVMVVAETVVEAVKTSSTEEQTANILNTNSISTITQKTETVTETITQTSSVSISKSTLIQESVPLNHPSLPRIETSDSVYQKSNSIAEESFSALDWKEKLSQGQLIKKVEEQHQASLQPIKEVKEQSEKPSKYFQAEVELESNDNQQEHPVELVHVTNDNVETVTATASLIDEITKRFPELSKNQGQVVSLREVLTLLSLHQPLARAWQKQVKLIQFISPDGRFLTLVGVLAFDPSNGVWMLVIDKKQQQALWVERNSFKQSNNQLLGEPVESSLEDLLLKQQILKSVSSSIPIPQTQNLKN